MQDKELHEKLTERAKIAFEMDVRRKLGLILPLLELPVNPLRSLFEKSMSPPVLMCADYSSASRDWSWPHYQALMPARIDDRSIMIYIGTPHKVEPV